MIDVQRVDGVLIEAVQSGKVPGVIALAANHADVLYQGAFGVLDAEATVPITVNSTFALASMTKLITSIAAMQLVERDLVNLDEPASRFAPDLADIGVLKNIDANGEPYIRKARRPITLRHLLTHTSGFSYRYWNTVMRDYQDRLDIPIIDKCQLSCLRIPLLFDPGDRWEYGISTDWVGQVIEGVSGQSLDQYMQENIFSPLRMNHTGFDLTPDITENLSSLHIRLSDTAFESETLSDPEHREFYDGGGGAYSNGPEYLRVLRMMLAGGSLDGEQVLRPETVLEMSRNQIGNLNAGSLRTAEPLHSNDYDPFPGITKPWGLATMITPMDRPLGRSAGSLCWAGMFNTYYWIDPRKDVTGLLVTQILPFADPIVLSLMDAFEHGIYEGLV